MRIIEAPKREEDILAAVEDGATEEEVKEGLVARGECCVDHLCGC